MLVVARRGSSILDKIRTGVRSGWDRGVGVGGREAGDQPDRAEQLAERDGPPTGRERLLGCPGERSRIALTDAAACLEVSGGGAPLPPPAHAPRARGACRGAGAARVS